MSGHTAIIESNSRFRLLDEVFFQQKGISRVRLDDLGNLCWYKRLQQCGGLTAIIMSPARGTKPPLPLLIQLCAMPKKRISTYKL